MFIEVYNIPLDMWNAKDEKLKIEENKYWFNDENGEWGILKEDTSADSLLNMFSRKF